MGLTLRSLLRQWPRDDKEALGIRNPDTHIPLTSPVIAESGWPGNAHPALLPLESELDSRVPLGCARLWEPCGLSLGPRANAAHLAGECCPEAPDLGQGSQAEAITQAAAALLMYRCLSRKLASLPFLPANFPSVRRPRRLVAKEDHEAGGAGGM